MSDVVITRAQSADEAAWVALLPAIATHDSVAFVARDAFGTLLGAAGIGWQSWGDPPGFPAWIHVLPDHRRRGIGRNLARALIGVANGEAPALWSAIPIDIDGEAAAFAGQFGFRLAKRQFYFRADAPTFLVAMEKVIERLRRHDHIPGEAQIVSLSADNADAVAALIEQEVSAAPRTIRGLIAASLDRSSTSIGIDPVRSQVLLLGSEVVGALLTQRLEDGINSRIIVNAVSPKVRRGWANAQLLEATTRSGVDDECHWFDFDCGDDVKDTIGLARRGNARLIRTDGLFYAAIASAPD